MHELYATQAILDKALQKAGEENAKHITNVYIVVGEISSYSDDSVQFYWDTLSEGTPAAGARLYFRRVPLAFKCLVCDSHFAPRDASFDCPRCGSVRVRVATGREFNLEAIDLEEP